MYIIRIINTSFPLQGIESNDGPYTWAVDLSKTEPHWRGWFENLSNNFLAAPAAKLLMLAGVDRLDKDLTVGQMQVSFRKP